MKPYYQDSAVTIWHGDCQDILPTLGEAWAKAIVTDPPFFMPATTYPMISQPRGGTVEFHPRQWGDTNIMGTWFKHVLSACVPCLSLTGHFFTFCNTDSYAVFFPHVYSRFHFSQCLVWDKGRGGLGKVFLHAHELILMARWKTSEFSCDAKPTPDILRHSPTAPTQREHPVEKPEALLEAMIVPTCNAGDVVLDPFTGSGSTLLAAKRAGRKAVGVEVEERFCEIAARRCASEMDFGTANPSGQSRADCGAYSAPHCSTLNNKTEK